MAGFNNPFFAVYQLFSTLYGLVLAALQAVTTPYAEVTAHAAAWDLDRFFTTALADPANVPRGVPLPPSFPGGPARVGQLFYKWNDQYTATPQRNGRHVIVPGGGLIYRAQRRSRATGAVLHLVRILHDGVIRYFVTRAHALAPKSDFKAGGVPNATDVFMFVLPRGICPKKQTILDFVALGLDLRPLAAGGLRIDRRSYEPRGWKKSEAERKELREDKESRMVSLESITGTREPGADEAPASRDRSCAPAAKKVRRGEPTARRPHPRPRAGPRRRALLVVLLRRALLVLLSPALSLVLDVLPRCAPGAA